MNIYEQEQNYKLETYNFLMDTYVNTINELIDNSYSFNILPLKIIFGISYIKKYINENRFEILENGINYLVPNKEIILNFDINKLDDLDIDSNDNISIKTCVNKLKKNNIESESDDILNLIIDIKNNTKKLKTKDIQIIKKYFELIIIILEKIKNLFY